MVTQRSPRRVNDRYNLLEPLGRGGMGTVWLADDALLERRVAVKQVEFPAGMPTDEVEAMRARVMREARAAARLNHLNVTTIYDVLTTGDTTWIVMEYVAAPTLGDIVATEGPLSPPRAAEVGLQILSALDAAHASGIVHRDVKPSNVMVADDGKVKLADFGVAAVQGDPKITVTGLIVGSPSYMAPEQAQEGATSTASDLWGLGATLYFAVEGRPPFDKGAAIPTLTAVTYEPPEPMQRAGDLELVVSRLLTKDPDQRPASPELRSLLQDIAGDDGRRTTPAAARTVPLDEPDSGIDDDAATAPQPERREPFPWPWVLAAVALLVVAVAGLRSMTAPAGAPASAPTQAPPETSRATDSTEREDVAPDAAEDGDASAEQGADDSGDSGDTSAAAESPPDAGVPPDWSTFAIGDTGATVAHPPDWSVRPRGGTVTDIVDPGGGRYLRVDHTDTPGDDAAATWEEYSDSFGANHADYRELRIAPYDYEGAETAALWEYTYREGGARLHAYNLAIVIGGRGYALNFQTRESQWAESQDLWEQLVAGFDPAR